MGQEQSRLNPTDRVVDQGRELLPLLVGKLAYKRRCWRSVWVDFLAPSVFRQMNCSNCKHSAKR